MAFWIDFAIKGFLEFDNIMVSVISPIVLFWNKRNLFLVCVEYDLSAVIDKNLVLFIGNYEQNRILGSYVFFQIQVFWDI